MNIIFLLTCLGCNKKKLTENLRIQPDKEEYDINDQVTFSCENGLTVVGERISHCAGFTMWNTDDPICTSKNNLSFYF